MKATFGGSRLHQDVVWVARHVMGQGLEPHCRSGIGGVDCGEGGCSTWFVCKWCGKTFDDPWNVGLCEKTPVMPFTVVDVMREALVSVWVRNDPERESKVFTLLHGGERIADTDDPLVTLCSWLRGYLGEDYQNERENPCEVGWRNE